jgi:uroporphyrinogen decarboxylase
MTFVLARSNDAEIKSYTSMLIEKLGGKGGYAIGSGNSIAHYIPLQNYITMLEIGWKSRNKNI